MKYYLKLMEIMLRVVFMNISAIDSVLAETLSSPVITNNSFFILSYLYELLLPVRIVAE